MNACGKKTVGKEFQNNFPASHRIMSNLIDGLILSSFLEKFEHFSYLPGSAATTLLRFFEPWLWSTRPRVTGSDQTVQRGIQTSAVQRPLIYESVALTTWPHALQIQIGSDVLQKCWKKILRTITLLLQLWEIDVVPPSRTLKGLRN